MGDDDDVRFGARTWRCAVRLQRVEPLDVRAHVDDLADLYLVVLAKVPTASIFNGAHGSAIPLIAIARAASKAAGTEGRVADWLLEEARQVLGASRTRSQATR